jgi:hypothetical protein
MRFRKWPRPTAYEEASRKRAAFLAKQRHERQALPLFAEVIAAGQHGVDTEMARRAEWWPQQQEGRDLRALRWREARVRLFAFDDPLRRTIRAIWRTCPYPADPASFADLLHQIRVGKVDPHRPPWKFHAAVQARTTPDPKRFDEAFRQIGRRTVVGGPSTTPADELLFCGNLGFGTLFLTSRVKLIDPNQSCYTSSNRGRRDSHVGRADHGVDIEVRGVCREADLALIERLASEADERPVVVGRVERPIPMAGERPSAPPHRLLILACSATKRHDQDRIPARDRYDGPLWRTLRAVDPDGCKARVSFLSARFGFRGADTPIEDYDARLTPDLAQRMITSGMITRWPRPPRPSRPDSYGMHPGAEIASLSYHGARPFTDVALVGGHLYLDVMRSFLASFRDMRCVTADARVTVINAGIGVMRPNLHAWLEAPGR